MQPYIYDYNLGSAVPMPVGAVGVPYPMQVVPITNQQVQDGQIPIQSGQIPVRQQIGGIQLVYVEDPLSELNNCTEVVIKQQPEFFEMITGCETANRYHVFGVTPQGMKYLFKCMERSDWCMRACCPSNIREFNMEIYHIVNGGIQINSKKFANAFKPLKCSCFCCNRPEILVNMGEESTLVGRIKHKFSCFDPEFEVFESNGNLKYFVHADCCQCGLLCSNNICGKFSTAVFNIYSVGTNSLVATISKMSAQSYSEVVTDADSYKVTFPSDASPNDKILLIVLGLMIDYQYFESDASNDKSRRSYYYRRY